MTDYDQAEWQARQVELDRQAQRQRDKLTKARARAARNAKRKLDRLRTKLESSGDLTEWENEFSESVSERLETYGAAFRDFEKGRRSDALSYAQKRVVAALNKKAKGATTQSKKPKSRSGFKSKSGYKPRIRQIEDDLPETTEAPYIPTYAPEPNMPKKPFLRLIK